MRAAAAIALGFVAGMLIAFVDLRSALLQYSYEIAQVLYYTGLDGLTLLVAFLLSIGHARSAVRSLLLFVSAFFAIQSLWNMVYAIIAYYTGTLHFPLDLGLGQFVNVDQYYIGILVQLFISFVFYLFYRLTSSHP
jgi:hypothetical protein